jgi:hypothetical protein
MKKLPEGMWLNQDFCWSEKPQEEIYGGMNMEAPEKIYVTITHPLSDKYVEMIAFEHGDGIEYARTDAFIDKACVKLKKLMYDSLMFQGRLYREEAINSFVEEFKNYIKEE